MVLPAPGQVPAAVAAGRWTPAQTGSDQPRYRCGDEPGLDLAQRDEVDAAVESGAVVEDVVADQLDP